MIFLEICIVPIQSTCVVGLFDDILALYKVLGGVLGGVLVASSSNTLEDL
jgi:hypothetical protein